MDRSIISKRLPMQCAAWLLLLVVAVSLAQPAPAVSISDARATMAQFREELKAALEAQTRNDTQSYAQHQTKAQEYLKQARTIFETCRAGASGDPDVLREYADVLARDGDPDLAAEVLERLVKRVPDDAAGWRELGRALSALGHPRAKEAADALRRALEIDASTPEAANAHVTLGRVYRQEGLFDLAREHFTQACALDPNNVPARLGLIGARIQDGQMREASDELDTLSTIPPEYAAQAPALLAEAVARFEESRKWFPDTAENHIGYAKILFRLGRFADSLDAAERSAKLNPDAYTTWNFVGDLSRRLGNTTRAKEAYTHSLAIKPDQPRTQEGLTQLEEGGGSVQQKQ